MTRLTASQLLETLREIVGGSTSNCAYEDWGEMHEDAEYDGKSVTLNKPFRSDDTKHKFYVYVKNDKGNVIRLGFGDPNMEIKRDDPARRKAYRDRHNCADPGPKWKANYWSCRMWADKPVSKIIEASESCPTATQDISLNLKNRQKAIREYGYGPLNPNEPNDAFWAKKAKMWQLDDADDAKKSVCGNCAAFDQTKKTLDCIAQGIGSDNGSENPYDVIDAGQLGYCRFLKFKCAAKRTCDAWVVGGPIR